MSSIKINGIPLTFGENFLTDMFGPNQLID